MLCNRNHDARANPANGYSQAASTSTSFASSIKTYSKSEDSDIAKSIHEGTRDDHSCRASPHVNKSPLVHTITIPYNRIHYVNAKHFEEASSSTSATPNKANDSPIANISLDRNKITNPANIGTE